MVESIGKGYKPWLILCILLLVGSLALLTLAVGGWFFSFDRGPTPLWVTVVGTLAVLGFAGAVAGLLGIMGFAALRAAREDRRKVSTSVPAQDQAQDSMASLDRQGKTQD